MHDGNFRLEATGCPADEFAVFYYGAEQIQFPFGDGWRCVGGQVFRLPVFTTGPNGSPTHLLDVHALPGAGSIVGGSRWSFQCWYRDPAAAGAGFNLSDAMGVTFCP